MIPNVRVREGWENAGTEGVKLATVKWLDRIWVVVAFEGEDEPELVKAEALEALP